MKKILVVDNDRIVLEFMTKLLEKEGYHVIAEVDGLKAVDVLKTYTPDFIFVDLVMPNIDGEMLCRIIRGMPELKNSYLIVLSAIAAEEWKDISQLGADACIAKGPFNEMAQHVLYVIDQPDIASSKYMSGKVLGLNSIFPRSITKELLSVKKNFEIILEGMSEGILEVNSEGRIVYANVSALSIIKAHRNQLLGLRFTDLFSGKDYQRICDLMTSGPDKLKSITEDAPVFLNGSQITVNMFHVDKNKLRSIIILYDVSDRKLMEAKLLQAQKLEAIGVLAAGIAHDFNNLLSVIIGNIELAKSAVSPESEISDFLSETEKAWLQAKELTEQLITFSKGGAPVKKTGAIEDLIKETTNFTLSGSNIKSDFFFPYDLWFIDFDKGQIKHALKNLINNAVESMPDDGTIDVRAENFNITAKRDLPLPEGKYVKILIRDQGIGIPEEHLSKIFDPYFSTKEMGEQKGMGLGLATTYSILNRHDGHITVESEVGVGTTFTLYLPAHEKDVKELELKEISMPEKPSIRTGRILLMDDEEMVRNLGKQVLSRLGYDAELAKDGAEAIELYKRDMDLGKPYDAVILDLSVKGGMGGKDAVKKILEINPHAKAIVSSGYSNDPVMTDYRKYGFVGALPKPYTMKDLSGALDKGTKK